MSTGTGKSKKAEFRALFRPPKLVSRRFELRVVVHVGSESEAAAEPT